MNKNLENITIVTELYYPEETSTGYILTKIAEGLSNNNKVTVLCSQPTYSALGIRAPKYERRNQVDIVRCASSPFNKNKLIYKFINVAVISLSIFLRMLFHVTSKQQVLVVTNPPLLPYLAAFVCWLKGARCILLVHDVYPEVLIVVGMISPNGIVSRIGKFLSKCLYKNFDVIVVLGRDMRALILEKLGIEASKKIVVIPNWSDVSLIIPSEKAGNHLLCELNLNKKFIVQYAGNMGRTHGIEIIISAAEQLMANKEIHFLFIGSGAKRNWLEGRIKNNLHSNITLLPSKPRDESLIFLNACDVAIISFMAGMSGISVPSRMYNILAAGKPIIAIADPSSELALVIEEEKIGWVVPPGNKKMLEEVILYAKANNNELRMMGVKARAVAESKYTLEKILNSYQSLFVHDTKN